MSSENDVNEYVEQNKEAIMRGLDRITDGYYIVTRFGMKKVPRWVYRGFRAMGGTVAHAWTSPVPLDADLVALKLGRADVDADLDKIAEQIREEGK